MRARAVDVRLRLPVESSSLGCGQVCALLLDAVLVLDEVLVLARVQGSQSSRTIVAHTETELTERASLHSSKSSLKRRSVAM